MALRKPNHKTVEWYEFYRERINEKLCDPSLEEAIVGAMMASPECIADAETLHQDDFAHIPCRIVFGVIMEMYAKRQQVDLVTVHTELKSRDLHATVGDYAYLTHLFESAGLPAMVPGYVRQLKDISGLRRLADVHLSGLSEILKPGVTYDHALSTINGRLADAIGELPSERILSAEQCTADVVGAIQRREQPRCVTTGFPSLDSYFGGWTPGCLYVIAGRPSMGKTSLAVTLFARSVVPAYFVSLEMSSETISEQLLACQSLVSNERIRSRQVTPEELKKLEFATQQLAQKRLLIEAPPTCSIDELRLKCRRLSMRDRLGLVIVDYLQRMRGPAEAQNREQEIAAISSGLKAVAKEMGVPVVALAALNRGAEIRADRRPVLADLRESGAIESDADVVMLLYREEYYHPGEDVGSAEVNVAKNRTGRTGTIRLRFLKEFSRFEEVCV